MMDYSLTIREEDFKVLQTALFSSPGSEGAAYLLCGESRTTGEIRLLAREVIPVVSAHYQARRADFLSILSSSYVSIAKRAKNETLSIVFAHSHPGGFLEFSSQDDREEQKLQEFFHARVPGRLHGALVLTENAVIGRVYDGQYKPMKTVRIVGNRFSWHHRAKSGVPMLSCFDRQIRAFGQDVQVALNSLHVGVVGAGGTGSALIEQLARLGVGTLSIFDGDILEASNVNRVYGAGVSDAGQHKVSIAKRNVERMGLGTRIQAFPEPITHERIARHLRDCDVIFGCTDKQIPRSILIQISLRYLIPVIDMGVLIASRNSIITDVVGRVTTILPGEACLFCRKRITPEGIRFESLSDAELTSLIQEGYAPELGTPNPAVIAFTSGIASFAVSEFLHRMTGYMGHNRNSSEMLCFFDQTQLHTNRLQPNHQCICAQRRFWGEGDSEPFLDSVWAD